MSRVVWSARSEFTFPPDTAPHRGAVRIVHELLTELTDDPAPIVYVARQSLIVNLRVASGTEAIRQANEPVMSAIARRLGCTASRMELVECAVSIDFYANTTPRHPLK